MKYAIISDIHSNLEALESVLNEIKNVEKIICLGDIVGYGANPNECCEIIKNLNCISIVGNHDLASIEEYDIRDFNPYAKAAILWTRNHLKEENKIFLRNLKEKIIFKNLTLIHGSLVNPSFYILDTSSARESFSLQETKICFIGHTHTAECYIKSGNFLEQIDLFSGGIIEIKENFQYIINCGSVGQPRDRNYKASFGIYDEDNETIEIKRIHYPLEIAYKKIINAHLPKILADRLAIGY